MQITNGTVEYERTVKPADYEKRGARLTLSFAVDEAEVNPHAVVAKVFDMAVAEVHHRIGLNGPAYVRRLAETDTAKVAPYTAGVEVASSASGRIEPETAGIAVVKAKKEAAAAPPANPTTVTPADVSPPEPAAGTKPASSLSDPLAIVAPPTAPVSDSVVEITDSDLHTAVHQTLDRGVTAIQVRNLTDTFTGVVGQSMRTLPQDQRPAFLAALKELQPE